MKIHYTTGEVFLPKCKHKPKISVGSFTCISCQHCVVYSNKEQWINCAKENEMNKKPEVKDVLEILRMKNDAVALYDEIDRRVNDLCENFGADRFDYDLGTIGIDDRQYLKFEITDNVQKLKDGETVWKSIPFRPVSYALSLLKNCPKSLK